MLDLQSRRTRGKLRVVISVHEVLRHTYHVWDDGGLDVATCCRGGHGG